MGQAVGDPGSGGCGHLEVGYFLSRHSAGRPDIQRRDLGFYPAHQEADGGFPPQGELEDIDQKTQASVEQDLRVPPVGGSYAGGWFGKYVDLNLQAPEYGHKIHFDATYSVPLPGGGLEARIAGYK